MDNADIEAMEEALADERGYESAHGLTRDQLYMLGSFSGDTGFPLHNLQLQWEIRTVQAGNGSVAAVPEPSSLALACFGAIALFAAGSCRRGLTELLEGRFNFFDLNTCPLYLRASSEI